MSQLAPPTDRRAPEATLAADVRLLAEFLDLLGANVDISKFLKGFLPEIAADLVSESSEGSRVMVTFFGGRGVGKSTLFNWMAGRLLAPTGWVPNGGPGSLASFLGEPEAVDSATMGLIPEPTQFGSVMHRVKTVGLEMPVLVHDSPRDVTERGAMLGRSHGVIFVTSAERYADVMPFECARWCALAGCQIIPILNMVDEKNAVIVRNDWKGMLDSRLANPLVSPTVIPWISRSNFQSKGSEVSEILWNFVCRMCRQGVQEKKRMKQQCIVAFLELMDKSGLGLRREFLADATVAIHVEAVRASREFMAAARARLRSNGFSAGGRQLLELLEVPGPGRIWSLGFRIAGWPVRQWLFGRREEQSHEISETIIRRILGNWIAKVRLFALDLAMNKGLVQKDLSAAVRWESKTAQRIDLAPFIAKAAELDALLGAESNTTARESLVARPVALGMLRAIIALGQFFCLASALWYGSGGFLSLVYLVIFAGFADMLLALAARLPLYFIERQALMRWEKRVGEDIIGPCSKLLEEQLAHQAGPAVDAIAAAERVRRTLAALKPVVEKES